MKKIIIIILIILVASFGYLFYKNYSPKVTIPELKTETDKVAINKLYVYGTTFNLGGTINLLNYESIKLTLYNGKFKDYDVLYDNGTVTISNEINNGLYLDNISKGQYFMFLKVGYKNPDSKAKNKTIYKYYNLDNQTTYKETTYYTISNYNNKIVINSQNKYNTLMLNINKNTTKDIYDIVIDPGHGGMDGGAAVGEYCEDDFTMNIADSLKKKLEAMGLKVKLTREDNTLTKNQIMEEYGPHGRAVISNEVHAKYTFSIHLNSNASTSVHGLEIYTPVGINYDFANNITKLILEKTSVKPSTNKIHKKYDAVYSRNFTANEITEDANKKTEKGYKPYDITENSNYFYMIRETGGIMTGAYVDNRNPDISTGNPYYNSNIGNETYLLEYGYITNATDLQMIINEQDGYTTAIAEAIKEKLNLKS